MNRLRVFFVLVFALAAAGIAVWFSAAGITVAAQEPATSAPLKPLDLRDGDRVVFIGGTFVERMQHYGHLEMLLTVAHAEKHLAFRNLGWSGDTVWGDSRGVFGTAAEGFKRLHKDVTETKPTVIVICYGANEAHAGLPGLPNFVAGLNKLISTLSATKARFLLISPPQREQGTDRLPKPQAYNEVLAQYAKAIEAVARERQTAYFDLFAETSAHPTSRALTINGMHYSEFGDWAMAPRMAKAFNTHVPPLSASAAAANASPEDLLKWKMLRSIVEEKNILFFHRHRPQNETYLFLFRKHEQGNNAVEIPQFDPLIEDKERQIFALPKPNLESFLSLKFDANNLASGQH